MVSHLDSLWNRGTKELGNDLFESILENDCQTEYRKKKTENVEEGFRSTRLRINCFQKLRILKKKGQLNSV